MIEREKSGHLDEIQEQRKKAEGFLNESAFPRLAQDSNLEKTMPDLRVTRIPLNEVTGKEDNAGIELRWSIYTTIYKDQRTDSWKMVEIL